MSKGKVSWKIEQRFGDGGGGVQLGVEESGPLLQCRVLIAEFLKIGDAGFGDGSPLPEMSSSIGVMAGSEGGGGPGSWGGREGGAPPQYGQFRRCY